MPLLKRARKCGLRPLLECDRRHGLGLLLGLVWRRGIMFSLGARDEAWAWPPLELNKRRGHSFFF